VTGGARVTIPAGVRAAMVAHARREAPKECCGFLVGASREVAFALELTNVHRRSRTRFRVDPRDHIDVRRVLRRMTPSLDVLGVYHSHPAGGATPSRTDLAEALYPDWLYVIIGLAGGRPTCGVYRISAGAASRLEVRWTGQGRRGRP
jgi:proteasome lid subunit RPN8/RPN11